MQRGAMRMSSASSKRISADTTPDTSPRHNTNDLTLHAGDLVQNAHQGVCKVLHGISATESPMVRREVILEPLLGARDSLQMALLQLEVDVADAAPTLPLHGNDAADSAPANLVNFVASSSASPPPTTRQRRKSTNSPNVSNRDILEWLHRPEAASTGIVAEALGMTTSGGSDKRAEETSESSGSGAFKRTFLRKNRSTPSIRGSVQYEGNLRGRNSSFASPAIRRFSSGSGKSSPKRSVTPTLYSSLTKNMSLNTHGTENFLYNADTITPREEDASYLYATNPLSPSGRGGTKSADPSPRVPNFREELLPDDAKAVNSSMLVALRMDSGATESGFADPAEEARRNSSPPTPNSEFVMSQTNSPRIVFQASVLEQDIRKFKTIGSGGGTGSTVHLSTAGALVVACKRIPIETYDEEQTARLLREIVISQEMVHENIVSVLWTTLEPRRYISLYMEYFETTLDEQLLQRAAAASSSASASAHCNFNEREIYTVVNHIASALAYMHRHNIVHCDVKPSNVFMHIADEWAESVCKLADFGELTVHNNSKGLRGKLSLKKRHRRSMNKGTLVYMAPEMISFEPSESAKGVYTSKVDVWSLGIVLFQLLHGGLYQPYQMENVRNLDLSSHVARGKRPNIVINEITQSLPELCKLYHRCTRRKESSRPSAADVCNVTELKLSTLQ